MFCVEIGAGTNAILALVLCWSCAWIGSAAVMKTQSVVTHELHAVRAWRSLFGNRSLFHDNAPAVIILAIAENVLIA